MPDSRRPSLDPLAVVLLVGCCFLWGLNQVAAKVALAEVPPLAQAAVRSLGGTALVAAWSAWRGVPLFARDGTLRGGLAAGALFAAEFGCIFLGLQYTTASRMVVFIYLAPFVVALGMPFVSRAEKLSPTQWAGLVLAFGGVAGTFAEGFAAGAGGSLKGDALGVAAGVLWGATTLVVRATRLATASAEKTLFYQLGVSGVLLAAAAVGAGDGLGALLGPLSPLAVASLVFQVAIVAFASYLAWFWLVRHYPATQVSAFTLLTPIFGLALGAGLLGEAVTPWLLLGLLGVCAGIALVNWRRG